MGFCLLNGVAVGAAHALSHARASSAWPSLDFDVHHGNGTVAAFKDDPRVLVCSSFQFPHYPYRLQDVDRRNVVNTPLPAGTSGFEFRKAVERDWLPALDAFRPQLILVSAGFDAHADDPLGDLLLGEDDFAWVTEPDRRRGGATRGRTHRFGARRRLRPAGVGTERGRPLAGAGLTAAAPPQSALEVRGRPAAPRPTARRAY